ncbi:hypothetical protein SLS59_003042 [Nothophoma quercina]|uniref:Uncharacterized protein n=1 Tax=Nothophoma quercina TaxID=749835 RepID=A0ABR3RNA2_9PLEO
MEAREGRSGNAFACERCKGPAKLHAPFSNFEQVVSTRFDVFPQTPLAYAKDARLRQEAGQNICHRGDDGTGLSSTARTAVGNHRALPISRESPANLSACAGSTGQGITSYFERTSPSTPKF